MSTQRARGRSTYATGRTKKKNNRHAAGRRRARPAVVLLGLTLILTVSVAGALMATANGDVDRVTRGVSIDGVDISGMTYQQILDKLQPAVSQTIAATTATFTYLDQSWAYSGQQLGVEANLHDLADQALMLAVGEDGKRDREEARRVKDEGVALTLQYRYDEQLVQAIFEQISQNLGLPAEEATIVFDPDAGDTPQQMFTIKAGRDGVTLHKDKALSDVFQNFSAGKGMTLALPIEDVKSEYSEEFLKRCTTPLIRMKDDENKWKAQPFRTKVGGTKDRKKNVELALSKFNGMVIQPGQTVSFNETTGERSAGNGYLQAPGVAGDYTSELTYGGGVCQASTTLYNAALMANCRIDQRSKHSIASTYVKKGFDAMVNWPNSDLKFTNVSEGPMFIKAWYDGQYANVQIYGLPLPNDWAIERVSTIVEKVLAPEEVDTRVDKDGEYAQFVTYKDEEYVYREASDGVKAQASLVYWNLETGEKADEKVLYTDYYRPFGKIVYVGKQTRPATETPAPPAPTQGVEVGEEEDGHR
ncbi:MAG: VanW family protein [Eubacteriales bacterium]|nr:VanW family protein [Eubacteriales bacterium]